MLTATLYAILALGPAASAERPDLLIEDFEGTDYGAWKVEGTAFGTRPARGTLPGQMEVTGFLGKGLANSFHGGDRAIGTLTSPLFTIERHYINFLIGGGGHPGKTCMNLLVDGKVVRTATGTNTEPGGSEALDWDNWDVRDLAGRWAVIQIVDRHTGGWGHINVDHIYQSDRRRAGSRWQERAIAVTGRLLLFPVKTGAPKRRVRVLADQATVPEFDIELATDNPQFWVFLDVSRFRGQTLRIAVKAPDDTDLLAAVANRGDLIGEPLYCEKHRPQFHFTSRRGWLNDPNGLVWQDGVWHLFYQHNPYGWAWGNMHWGHAVSNDLIHWTEQEIALYPRQYGDWAFSGSAVVDHANTSGRGTPDKPALVAAFTSTGRGECLAYSTDHGRTWREYEGNPVVRHRGRDPKLLWHDGAQCWVMAVYDEHAKDARVRPEQYVAFYTSPDLKTWEFRSRIEGYYECPDLFELPVDGAPGQTKWVLYAADGRYALGRFDGRVFTPDGPKQQVRYGRFYAAQTYSNAPGGRRVQIGWAQGITFPGMPFNQQMTLPVELSLRATGEGPRLFANPVRELAALRAKSHPPRSGEIKPDVSLLAGIEGELLEIVAEIDPGRADTIGFRLRGHAVTWDTAKGLLTCGRESAPLRPEMGRLTLHLFLDRGSIEVFGNGGRVALSAAAPVQDKDRTLELSATGGPARVTKLEVHELRSAWR
jgi:fructan beta-fructosidase